MPFNTSLIIALVGTFIAIAVWMRTKRVGPVFGVFLGAAIVWLVANPSGISAGGNAALKAINWFITQLTF